MTTDRPRRLAAAASTILLSLGLTACGTGGDAALNQQYQPGIGANVRVGDVEIHNALLVRNEDGTLSFSAGLVNTSDTAQRLESATLTPLGGSETVEAEIFEPVTVAPNALYTIGGQGELAGIDGEPFTAGGYARVTLTFSGAGDVTVEAPSVERSPMYDSVASEPAGSRDDISGEELAETDEAGAAEAAAEESAAE